MDYLSGIAANTSVIPAGVTDFNEAALYVIENGERDFGEMMKKIGLKELITLEATGQVITNEASIKEIKNSIIEWLKKRWADIKGFFTKVINWLNEKISRFKHDIVGNKAKDQFKKAIEKMKDKDKDGRKKMYPYYEFPHYKDATDSNSKILNTIATQSENIENTMKKYSSDNLGKDYYETMKANMRVKILGSVGVKTSPKAAANMSAETVGSHIRNWIIGKRIDIDKAFISNNFEDMFETATNSNKALSAVKNVLNAAKKHYDKAIKDLASDKKERGIDSKTYHTEVKLVKDVFNVINAACGSISSAIKQKVAVCQKIVMKAAPLAILAADRLYRVKEDYEDYGYESSAYQSELVSLFNF